MTVLTPCRRCNRREDCQIRRDVTVRLRGLGITKANLNCKLPQLDFPVGARVEVEAFELEEASGYGDYRPTHTVRSGVVTRWKGNKATIVLDKSEEIAQPSKLPIAFLHAEPDRLTRIDAPLVEMCKCGALSKERCAAKEFPTLREGSGDWFCHIAAAEIAASALEHRWS